MNLQDILKREMNPKPWAEGERMPWDDPAFSERVLKMHLAQDNDAASRPEAEIKKHVSWIHHHLLKKQPGRILDLGCGPGLYTARLAKLGHTCTGIDFAPASIEYALKNAPAGCTYRLGDIRKEDLGGDYDLVIFIFGALNLMQRKDARLLLAKTYRALKPGGILLLEVSSFDAVDEIGNQPAMWYSAESGLFSNKPHVCLMETFWDEKQNAATERFYIVDINSGEVTRHAATTQAYEDDEIDALLKECKFDEPEYYPSLTGKDEDEQFDFLVLTARKPD
ncbi:MAG TPA: class I SAM-dependent methyltransferase [Anaerolineales bacterium]|jgi:SAM-dependent methyltransferase